MAFMTLYSGIAVREIQKKMQEPSAVGYSMTINAVNTL